ncbi:MAG TPA: beta-ketoacyl-[acyl-carrier-protein] synthase family protein [Kofleriaceae bacterium]|nr:beta-ketoacyl-[acyl-carrier-protein] synthase family protein [Kofleriaceae bacterium]
MTPPARRSVYVRGVGAFTPLAPTWSATVAQLADGACAIREITAFDATGFPCRHAAAIDRELPDEDRRMPYARAAAREAWMQARLAVASARLGVFVGAESGRGRWATVLGLARAARGAPGAPGASGAFDHARFAREARPWADRIDASVLSPSAVAVALAHEVGAHGPVETVSLACASGSAAIVEAARAIRLGEIDAALCGGVGADVDPLMLAGFGLLGILSPRGVSCPFDAHRDGFVVGEGAAMLVLSAERGDAVVELAGIGRSLDAHRLTAPDPEGSGAARAMSAALADAGLAAVDYVQAHGTSTPLNDRIEVAAIRRVLGAAADRARVSSSKGALGHWVAGAGALGALYAYHAIAAGEILPTANLRTPDPLCDVPHVIGRAVRADVHAALASSFAFGGANSCLVLRRCG